MKPSTGFNGVDCSNGTCSGCDGVFGFEFDSAVVGVAESAGSVNLTLVRLAGTDGPVTVTVGVSGGNATNSSDYGGSWPAQVRIGNLGGTGDRGGRITLYHCHRRELDG